MNGSGPGSASGSLAKSQSSRKAPSRKSGSIHKVAKSSLASTSNERSVRRLRLTKALTLPDTTSVADACRRMATRRVDACLLTDSNGMLCGIMTDRDLALRCVGEGLDVNTTLASQIMTRNPTFVTVDTSAVDALQRMVQGKFRHLPVIENGEVVALLNITRCLYDAIARMERAAEKGNAIAAAIEGVERQWGAAAGLTSSGFVETFREKIFRPTLGSILGDQIKLVVVQKSDVVLTAARKMKAARSSAAVVTNGLNNKPCGIITSKDILMRVLALSLKPEETIVEKVMTPNPECVSLEVTIVDALHAMHDGKFLHLPVVDREGNCVACVDVVQLTQGAMTTAAGVGADAAEANNQLMQRFWDSALALDPVETDDDIASVRSGDTGDQFAAPGGRQRPAQAAQEEAEEGSFFFKMEDRRGRVHKFTCSGESMTELLCNVCNRLGNDYNPDNPPTILYDDEDGDKVVMSVDEDLAAAIRSARAANVKAMKLYLEYHDDEGEAQPAAQPPPVAMRRSPVSSSTRPPKPSRGAVRPTPQQGPPPPRRAHEDRSDDLERFERTYRAYTWSMVGITAAALVSIGVAVYLQRNK